MKKEKSTTVTGYKALSNDFTCQGHQYEVGKTYIHKGKVEICKCGFHFCELPLSVLNYYDLVGSRFAEVESDDVRESQEDKSVAGNITIKKEIGFGEMIKAQIAIIFSFCFTKTGGECKDPVIASDEKHAQLASSGDGAQLASSGDGAKLASSGYGAKLKAEGSNSAVAGIGYENSASGAKGNWLTLAEWKWDGNKYELLCVKTEQVDGKRIKAGVAYVLKEGEFEAI